MSPKHLKCTFMCKLTTCTNQKPAEDEDYGGPSFQGDNDVIFVDMDDYDDDSHGSGISGEEEEA